MQTIQRAVAARLVMMVAVLTTVVLGCGLPKSPPMTGAIGAATVDELLDRYKAAHRAKNIKLLRPLLLVNSDWLARRGDKKDSDAAMLEICSHRLVRLDLDTGPGPRGGVVAEQVSYHIAGPSPSRETVKVGGSFASKGSSDNPDGGGISVPKGSSPVMLGDVYGKLILIVDKDTVVDPSYAVLKYGDRYYIHVLPFVLYEAADALKTGRKPKYIADPLGTKVNLLPLD
jgi:hypothetical protein